MIQLDIFVFALIICVHWFADFIMQDEQWATTKSKSNKALLKHTITYSLIWTIPVFVYTHDIVGTLYFVLFTFLIHTVTDYFTSRGVSQLFERKIYGSPIPNVGAFSLIGYDQMLHYIQLLFTWVFIFNNN